jgi:adenylylsulfate kinase-like enzyme
MSPVDVTWNADASRRGDRADLSAAGGTTIWIAGMSPSGEPTSASGTVNTAARVVMAAEARPPIHSRSECCG